VRSTPDAGGCKAVNSRRYAGTRSGPLVPWPGRPLFRFSPPLGHGGHRGGDRFNRIARLWFRIHRRLSAFIGGSLLSVLQSRNILLSWREGPGGRKRVQPKRMKKDARGTAIGATPALSPFFAFFRFFRLWWFGLRSEAATWSPCAPRLRTLLLDTTKVAKSAKKDRHVHGRCEISCFGSFVLFVVREMVGGAHPTADACSLKPFTGKGLKISCPLGQEKCASGRFSSCIHCTPSVWCLCNDWWDKVREI